MKAPAPALKKDFSWFYYIKNSWIFLPALFYFSIVYQNAKNIPIMDDYTAILEFLNNFRNAGWGGKFLLLFTQHNEHRLLHSRIVYALYYTIFHTINFRNLIFIGDAQLIIAALVSVYFIRKSAVKYWNTIAFIWVLCLFDLNTYESGSIAMYGMQNYGVIMLFLCSLFFYDLAGKFLAPAALLQAICIFSSGNGLIASLFIVIFTLRSENKWEKIVSIITMAVFAPLYFVDYIWVSQPDKTPFDIRTVVEFFVKMSGAPFDFNYSTVFGIVLLIVIVIVFPTRSSLSNKRLWPFLCVFGFLLASMVTTSLFRACMKKAQFQTSRYLIYPQLVIATTYLFICLKSEGKKIQLTVLSAVFVLILYAYSRNYQFGKAGFERTAVRAEVYQYWAPDSKKCALIIQTACQSGIYCLEEERWSY